MDGPIEDAQVMEVFRLGDLKYPVAPLRVLSGTCHDFREEHKILVF